MLIFSINLRGIVSPDNVLSNTHPRQFTCLLCLIFIYLYLISSSFTSFELGLELNKIDFVLSSLKGILSLLSTNQSQILLKSSFNYFFISVTFLCWKSKHESSAYKYKSHSTTWPISLTKLKQCRV